MGPGVLLIVAGVAIVGNLLAPDAPTETIVLLENEGGGIGKIAINPGEDEVILDQAGQAAFIGEETETALLSPDEIAATFGEAIAVRPEPARSFTLYFIEGTTDLVATSEDALTGLFEDLARRAAPEITIIGHTDRVGSVTDNDQLALERAIAVRSWLIDQDVDPSFMDVAGRGEREPLVATADGVEEAQNRRVEVNVR